MTASELDEFKTTGVDPKVHDILRRRWSRRAFSTQPVSSDTLLTLFEAARWAASSANEQPWRFVVATKDNPTEYARILGCLVELNQVWAKLAAVLVITAVKTTFTSRERVNPHAMHDLGLATGNLMAQATSMGLFTHPMAGFDAEKARAVLRIPEGFDPATAIAIGYEGDPSVLPEDVRKRELAERVRKPLSDFLFAGLWGKSFE